MIEITIVFTDWTTASHNWKMRKINRNRFIRQALDCWIRAIILVSSFGLLFVVIGKYFNSIQNWCTKCIFYAIIIAILRRINMMKNTQKFFRLTGCADNNVYNSLAHTAFLKEKIWFFCLRNAIHIYYYYMAWHSIHFIWSSFFFKLN